MTALGDALAALDATDDPDASMAALIALMDAARWPARIAAKLDEQVARIDAGSSDDSDDDPEATGAILEVLWAVGSTADRRAGLVALRRLIAVD